MIGTAISHCLIERQLGAGGMGPVYLARDLALGRPAAIKLLPDRPKALLRARLLRDAEACAQLRPNARGSGHLAVQAQSGLLRPGAGRESLDAALRLFETRDAFDFSYVYGCTAGETLIELAAAAVALAT